MVEKPVGRVLINGVWSDLWAAGLQAACEHLLDRARQIRDALPAIVSLSRRANSTLYLVTDQDLKTLEMGRGLATSAIDLLQEVQQFDRFEVVLFSDRSENKLQKVVEKVEALQLDVTDAVDVCEIAINDRVSQAQEQD